MPTPDDMPAGTIRLLFLGRSRIERDGHEIHLNARKLQALLAYLAITRRPHARPALAGMFWGEMPETAALTNLRVSLSKLRKLFGLRITANRLEIAYAAAPGDWLDVAELERAAAQPAPGTVADLYHGDLLDDCYLTDAPAFEEWLTIERERLRHLALNLALRQGDAALHSGNYPAGIAAARRALQLEPWHEAAHRLLMALFAADGQTHAALAQFDLCRNLLAAELAAPPDPATVELLQAIRSGIWQPPARSGSGFEIAAETGSTAHNLPAEVTSFVGRQAERRQIGALLAEPGCRLLTIVAPGGSGKTRLARAAALDLAAETLRYSDGIYLVPLAEARATARRCDPPAAGNGDQSCPRSSDHSRHIAV
ncbi:MAG: hypothetical protein HC822_16050 [Oscillochloris sp.]|nr:hypothetical protein [Oscillochloris sp.]